MNELDELKNLVEDLRGNLARKNATIMELTEQIHKARSMTPNTDREEMRAQLQKQSYQINKLTEQRAEADVRAVKQGRKILELSRSLKDADNLVLLAGVAIRSSKDTMETIHRMACRRAPDYDGQIDVLSAVTDGAALYLQIVGSFEETMVAEVPQSLENQLDLLETEDATTTAI